MRVELKIEGGFAHVPGLARPLLVDADTLDDAAASILRNLCETVLSDATASGAAGATIVPDGRRYRVTIIDPRGTREIAAADPVEHPALSALIEFVQTHGRR